MLWNEKNIYELVLHKMLGNKKNIDIYEPSFAL